MVDFQNRSNLHDLFNYSLLSLDGSLDTHEIERLKLIRRKWNFYDGYHWEEIPEQDKPEVTENYCKAFVNKFVHFEFGRAFNIKVHQDLEYKLVNEDMTLFEYLSDVWRYNKQLKFCIEMGQMKSITGDSWIAVDFQSPGSFDDPYSEYPKGRLRIYVLPTSVVFPVYDPHDKETLQEVLIQYPIERETITPLLRKRSMDRVVYKKRITPHSITIAEGEEIIATVPNKYGVIPVIQIKNIPVAGRSEGAGDIDDIIPLNVELNMKKSDISEIIDYHSAPITLVFGAKVSSLEKGANKLWGGLPKDARVENLSSTGGVDTGMSYVADLKNAMSEIGGIPKGSLGGAQAISNTSSVALQYVNLPLIEKVRVKRLCSEEGLEAVNKLILLISLKEGLIKKPEDVSFKHFFFNEVTIPESLPKDMLLELQQISLEMKLGLEDRKGGMQRLNKEDIDRRIAEIDEDRKASPEVYVLQTEEVNSGFTNGMTPVEEVRKEVTGANGTGDILQ